MKYALPELFHWEGPCMTAASASTAQDHCGGMGTLTVKTKQAHKQGCLPRN